MQASLQIRLLSLAIALLGAAGCHSAPPSSSAAADLTPFQAGGRQLFVQYCGRCHEAYSSSGKNGPPLKGLFQKRYLPSGTPANDDRLRDVITMGRADMPAFGSVLTPEQVNQIIAYLHTL